MGTSRLVKEWQGSLQEQNGNVNFTNWVRPDHDAIRLEYDVE